MTGSKKIKVSELKRFDAAEYLTDEEAIAEYLTVVLEDGDPAGLVQALGTIARARGMSQIARDSGITREALYKALRRDASPRFETISRVCQALGVRLAAVPVENAAHA
ncbi:MAG: putative addiction module antidote protein [Zoogloeaceae bacterium]|jgi:probable addiction module antidote protein|nr:putative addiction module antidote protein [Zoogloeaceae bacterium]